MSGHSERILQENPVSMRGQAFIVADAHGRHDLVEGLLAQEGLLGDHEGTFVVQIGDLCNCVSSSIGADQECLRRVPDWFDVYLVGNHEHPYFDGPAFGGFWHDPEIKHLLRHYDARGLLRPCIAIDGVLVSHAGLSSHWGWLEAGNRAARSNSRAAGCCY